MVNTIVVVSWMVNTTICGQFDGKHCSLLSVGWSTLQFVFSWMVNTIVVVSWMVNTVVCGLLDGQHYSCGQLDGQHYNLWSVGW